MKTNRRTGFLVVLTLCLFGSLAAQSAWAQRTVRYVPGELLVKFRPGVPQHVIEEIHRGAGARFLRSFQGDPRLQHVRVPRNWPLESALDYYRSRADVQYAEPNLIYTIRDTLPNDPQFSLQWNWRNVDQLGYSSISGVDVRASQAWDKARGRFRVVVGELDTGVDYTHPDLALNIWTNPREAGSKCYDGVDDGANGYVDDCRGWNFVSGTNDPMDDAGNGHGTHVAGTIGAKGNNGLGVTGANWDVQIMPVKVFDAAGSGTLVNILQGIDYALANGAQVLNASWGGAGSSSALSAAIDRAGQQGVLFVAAAGNNGMDLDTAAYPFYPCAYPNSNVICVAAMNSAGDLSSYSNYGLNTVDLAAPGDSISSTLPHGGYGSLSGTSMAAPHVTGAVALVEGCKAGLSALMVKQVLLASAAPYVSLAGKVQSQGMVDYEAAINDNRVAGNGGCAPLPANLAPVAKAGGPYNSSIKFPIKFNGTPSRDPDGQLYIYFWEFGDGSTAVGPRPVHLYTSGGIFTVRLTVRDNLGAISTTTTSASIRPVAK